MNTIVLFSYFGKPTSTTVLESLQFELTRKSDIRVVTSKKNFEAWSEKQVKVYKSSVDPMKAYKKYFRSLQLRSTSLKLLAKKIRRFKIMQNSQHLFMQPHTARHFEYLKILKELPEDSFVFLVDSRDLIFQESPEKIASDLLSHGDLFFFDESGRYFKTGNDQIHKYSEPNMRWTRELLNNEQTEIGKLEEKVILNSGCIAGTVVKVRAFLELSCKVLLDSDYCDISLLDQASTNYVAHAILEDQSFKVISNGEIVLNMCGVIDSNVECVKGILQIDCRIIPIVHQFDRYGIWTSEEGFTFNKRRYEVQAKEPH